MQRHRHVSFAPTIIIRVVDASYEERSGHEWLRDALNRQRFADRIRKTAIMLEPILSSRLKSFATLDIQGFMIDGTFTPKELAFTINGCRIHHYLFKSPKEFQKLSGEEKKQVQWLERNHHRISYTSGHLDLQDVMLQPLLPVYKIFVKGSQKKKFLDALLPEREIIDLEFDYQCPNLVRAFNECSYHKNNYCICAKHNCKILYEYCNNNLDL